MFILYSSSSEMCLHAMISLRPLILFWKSQKRNITAEERIVSIEEEWHFPVISLEIGFDFYIESFSSDSNVTAISF